MYLSFDSLYVLITIIIFSYAKKINSNQHKLKTLYVIFPENSMGGPGALSKYINYMIRNNTLEIIKLCTVYLRKGITLKDLEDITHLDGNIVWFEQSNYFQYILSSNKVNFSHVLYGPNVSPISWMKYPYPRSYEMRWKEYMNKIFGYVIHYERVRDHLMIKSHTTCYKHKYLFLRPCTNVRPSSNNLKSWNNRKYDFLIFLKYADKNMKKYGKILIKLLKNYTKIIIKYGYYKYNDLLKYASESRCVIYYSFYDTGAIALQEIQNYGVFAIVLQSELVDNKNGVYLPELEYNIERAVSKCKIIIEKRRDSRYLSDYNINKHSCLKSFIKLYYQINKLL